MPRRHARKEPEVKKKPGETTPTEFDKLLRFILAFQGRFALAFIRSEDRRQREGVLASLADLLKERGIELRQIDLTYREVTDFLSTLKHESRQSRNTVIVIVGIEASLKGSLLASLNIQRDLLAQEIRCPILVWASSFALNLFAQEAPDFYDFRHTVFNFTGAGGREFSTPHDMFPRLPPIPFDREPTSDERTAYLLSLLEKYQREEESLGLRDKLAYGELLEEIARAYRGERHRTEALIYLEKALNIYQDLEEKRREASVLEAIGDIYYFSGNQTRARESIEKALPLYREIGDRLGEANALQSLGNVQQMQNAYAEAERFYHAALGIYSSIDDRYNQGATLLSLAQVYRSLSDREKAAASARQAKELLVQFPALAKRCDDLLQELGGDS